MSFVAALLIGLALVAAVLDWRAVAREDVRGERVFKPLTVALLIWAALFLREGTDGLRWALTLAALGFSLVGDVFLMLRPQRFVAGLGSFLVAHLAYIGAFRTLGVDVATLVMGGAVLAFGFFLNARLRLGMGSVGQPEMAVPVTLYFVVIAAMVTSALVTPFRDGWSGGRAGLAIAGALLFAASDSLIGWNRFVRSAAWGPVAIMVTYHLAQVCLVLALLA